ncbi:glutamine--fructose-6-phosphate aminotransferase, partial [Bacillus cereus]|nr:glutamine--fructose-6-phosphate aminotransferase [Bacillus cereus]
RVGIGHTRGATHGVPSKVHAHPHQCTSKRVTLVHNCVIENYELGKKEYLQDVAFVRESDTAIIVQRMAQRGRTGVSGDEAFR